MENTDLKYLRRCRQLARMGRASVAPNPPVGSVLVWKNRIIGEGFHQAWGKAHAEVNAINSVSKNNREKISASTLYVSLEPCNHQGRTPPCTQLILNSGIPRVVIASRDPFLTDNGGGVAYLKSKGVKVDLIDLYPTSELANFNESVSVKRPRIILKYAVSKNGYIGHGTQQVHLSGGLSQRRVHAMRAHCQTIMVGTNTVLTDNPRLDIRKYFGTPPTIVVLDRRGLLKGSENLFKSASVLYITSEITTLIPGIDKNHGVKIIRTADWAIPALMDLLYSEGIRSLFVEGGKKLMEAFIVSEFWDECYEIRTLTELKQGIEAPQFSRRSRQATWYVDNDEWSYYLPGKS